MNTGVFTEDGVSYKLMTVAEWNSTIKSMSTQISYWYNLYDEEVEAHTATREALEDVEHWGDELAEAVAFLEGSLEQYEDEDDDDDDEDEDWNNWE